MGKILTDDEVDYILRYESEAEWKRFFDESEEPYHRFSEVEIMDYEKVLQTPEYALLRKGMQSILSNNLIQTFKNMAEFLNGNTAYCVTQSLSR